MAREVTDFFVAVIGPYAVGKTALIMRFVTSQYPAVHEETLEEAYTKRVRLAEKEKTVLVEILDTAGHSNFFTLLPPVMKTYDGFVLVYDVTKKSSFDKIRDLVANIRRARGTDKLPPVVLAANKTDHKASRVVPTEDGQALAGSLGMEYIETSAKNDENCEEMFHVLLKKLKSEREKAEQSPPSADKSASPSGGGAKGSVSAAGDKTGDSNNNTSTQVAPLKSDQQRKRPGGSISRPMVRQSSKNKLKESDDKPLCPEIPNVLCFGLCALQPEEVALTQSVYVQELARDKIPEDLFPLPVLALKNLNIEREFSAYKFLYSFFLFPVFPFLVTYQTIGFVSGNLTFFPGEWQVDYSKTKEWAFYDIFGLLIGRDPVFDPEGLKDRKYFILQSDRQKTARLFLTFLTWICALIVCNNFRYVWRENDTYSIMETLGPMLIFMVMWSLFCSWHAYDFSIQDQLPRLSRLRGMVLLFGDDYRYKTTVYTLLRAYWRSKDAPYMISVFEFVTCITVGLLYCFIPSLIRVYVKKSSDENVRRKLFPQKFLLLTVGAFIVNFLFVTGFVYGMFRQYSGKFAMYLRWNSEMTNFLSVNSNFKSTDEVALKEITAPVDDQGRQHLRVRTIHNVEIQRDLASKAPPGGPDGWDPKNSAVFGSASLDLRQMHLSFGRNHNIAGWLDLRAYLGMEGQLLFGEQELPTLWLVVISMLLSLFLTFRVFFVSGNAYESALWDGMACLSLVCLVSLLLIASTSRRFRSLQSTQERLFAEQKLILQCSHTIDDRGKLTKLEAGFAKMEEAKSMNPDQILLQEPDGDDAKGNEADNDEEEDDKKSAGPIVAAVPSKAEAATEPAGSNSDDDDPLFSDSDSDLSDDLDISQALPSSEDEAMLYRAMSPSPRDGKGKNSSGNELDEKKDEKVSLLPKRNKTKRIVKLRKRLKANNGAKLNFISTAADIVAKKAIMPNLFGFDTANVLIATVIFMCFMAFLCALRLFV